VNLLKQQMILIYMHKHVLDELNDTNLNENLPIWKMDSVTHSKYY
jgi:hypothetical protein